MKFSLPSRKAVFRFAMEALVVLVIFFAVQAWLQRDMAKGPVPDFAAQTVSGGHVNAASLHGRTHLVYFWADWCPVCKLQRPAVRELAEDWPVLTVAMQSGDAAAVRTAMQKASLDWQTIADQDGSFSRQWGVLAVPSLFVVDSAGEIRFAERGYTSGWGMRLRLWWASLSS
ncbi:protein disulfide oxidoreductase [Granulosicoccaceae sp. 1_MG-2023]|nr:protein disulfide oxidoreductase [Granulosicoccaceae sp. 1_MG-2023]